MDDTLMYVIKVSLTLNKTIYLLANIYTDEISELELN